MSDIFWAWVITIVVSAILVLVVKAVFDYLDRISK